MTNDNLNIQIIDEVINASVKEEVINISVEGHGDKGNDGDQGEPGDFDILQDNVSILNPSDENIITHGSEPDFKRFVEVLSQLSDLSILYFMDAVQNTFDFEPDDILFTGSTVELNRDFGATGMVAYYVFDYDLKDVLDSDDFPGHVNHDAIGTNAQFGPGIVDNALYLDGFSAYMDIPNHSDFYIVDPTVNDIGFEFWIQTVVTDGEIINLWNEDDNRRSWRIYLQGGVLKFDISTDGINVTSTSIAISGLNDGNLHQVGIYLDNYFGGFYYKAFKDGVQVNIPGFMGSFSYPLFQNTIDPIRVGALGGTPSNYLEAYISELAIYRNYDLTIPAGMQSNIFAVHFLKNTMGQHLVFYDTLMHNVKTTSLSQINTSNWLGIISTGVDANLFGPYVVTMLVSMDSGTTWKMWDGAAWQTVSETTQGTLLPNLPQNKADWDLIFVPGTLDIILQLQTLDILNTPKVTSVNFTALLPGFMNIEDSVEIVLLNATQTKIKNVTGILSDYTTFYNVKTNIIL